MSQNPWVFELLRWHGHEKAGVKVPFDHARGNPLGSQIETGVLSKLSGAAQALAEGRPGSPRWIFLVGGPGNGKSEAVERFISALDDKLGLANRLKGVAEARFVGQSLLTRKVEIAAADLAGDSSAFAQRIGKLVIVQDASASDDPAGRACELLLHEIEDLLTSPLDTPPVFICCSNRGLLSSAAQQVRKHDGYENVAAILGGIIAATAHSRDASNNRPSCWPIDNDARFACWPMDVESLLEPATSASTFRKILAAATEQSRWDACVGCSDNELCPFLQNRELLASDGGALRLAAGLRRAELATGRRWNFREAFSLVAELIVGCRTDFDRHPCEWVHAKAGYTEGAAEASGLMELSRRLHYNALFPSPRRERVERAMSDASKGRAPRTEGLLAVAADSDRATHHVREILRATYSTELDPAAETPDNDPAELTAIENHYNHSARNGLACVLPRMRPLEVRLLKVFAAAEDEWEAMARASASNLGMRRIMRQEACAVAKRAISIGAGRTAKSAWIDEYASTIRDLPKLRRLAKELVDLLGKDNSFSTSLVESFGQPLTTSGLRLIGQAPVIKPIPAPSMDAARPGHDLPFLEITDARTMLPVTFELFLAIKLRGQGCSNSCLPAGTRAAIDRVRQLFAGQRCRDTDALAGGTVKILVFDAGQLQPDEQDQPKFEA